MPLLAGVLSSFFGLVAAYLAQRVTIGLAAAAAFVVSVVAAFAAVKVALAAIVAGLSSVVPPSIIAAVGYVMPDNVAVCLTAIWIADTVISTYDYWRANIGVAMQLAKG